MIYGDASYQEHGACRGKSPDLFFPSMNADEGNGSKNDPKAKAICATCPVQEECRTYAMDAHEVWGIWGGTDRRERAKLRRTYLEPFACSVCGSIFRQVARGFGGGGEPTACSDRCRRAQHAQREAEAKLAGRDDDVIFPECVVCGTALSMHGSDTCNLWCATVKNRRQARKEESA